MSYNFDAAAQQRIEEYVNGVGDILANKKRRASFGTYFMGLLADGERKSTDHQTEGGATAPRFMRACLCCVRRFGASAAFAPSQGRPQAGRPFACAA